MLTPTIDKPVKAGIINNINADNILASNQNSNAFVYCSNNPLNRTDAEGNCWEFCFSSFRRVRDAIKAAFKPIEDFINNTFGIAVYTETTDSTRKDYFVAGVETGVSSTTLISGNDEKAIVFYEVKSESGSSYGVSFNKGSLDLGFDSESISMGVALENTEYSLSLGLFESSFTVSNTATVGSGIGTTTVSTYVESFVKPTKIVAVAVLAKACFGASAYTGLVYGISTVAVAMPT